MEQTVYIALAFLLGFAAGEIVMVLRGMWQFIIEDKDNHHA